MIFFKNYFYQFKEPLKFARDIILKLNKMANNDDFKFVSHKKNRKKLNCHLRPLTSKHKDFDESRNENFDLQRFSKQLNACMLEITESDFFRESFHIISTALAGVTKAYDRTNFSHTQLTSQSVEGGILSPESSSSSSLGGHLGPLSHGTATKSDTHLLSYGIGSFSSCMIARFQLALLLSLKEKFGKQCTQCSVYDPIFSDNEKSVLESYNCQVISLNEEGCRECTAPTVAFLPHCGKALYNNLLWRNLMTHSSQGLHQLVLIGNSFSQMIERSPMTILKKTGNFIIQLQPYTREVALPTSFLHKDIFNDLAVHTFAKPDATQQLRDVIETTEKPSYDTNDVEIITQQN